MKIIDLTHEIFDGMPKIPSKMHTSTQIIKISDLANDGIERHQITMSCHSGTHVDAPSHMIERKSTVDKIKMNQFFGTATKVNLLNLKSKEISLKCFNNKKINKANYVIFQTGWEKHWLNNQYYSDHPYLTSDMADLLIQNKTSGICVDFPSVDNPNSDKFDVHKKLLKANILIVENVCNLTKLPRNGFKVIVLPLLLKGVEAAPARVCAVID